MNINELENLTGVTKQNIRYYEKKGLLHPKRNSLNNYREYTGEDLRILQVIKMLRKLDMPLEEIHQILAEEILIGTAIQKHLEDLVRKKSELESCINICKGLCDARLETLDVDRVLLEMDEIEKKGGFFMSIVNDYKQIMKEEKVRSFTFRPDTMVMNSKEFTEALLAYADENNLHIYITKEGMYPVFTIDNVEYTAERVIGRFGAVVYCTMTHPEEITDTNISNWKRRLFRLVNVNALAAALFLFILLSGFATGRDIWLSVWMSVCLIPILVWIFKAK